MGTAKGDHDLLLGRILQRGRSFSVGCLELLSDGMKPVGGC